jgi:hypothetical protein
MEGVKTNYLVENCLGSFHTGYGHLLWKTWENLEEL